MLVLIILIPKMLELKVFIFRVGIYIVGLCTEGLWVGNACTYTKNTCIGAWDASNVSIVNGLEI